MDGRITKHTCPNVRIYAISPEWWHLFSESTFTHILQSQRHLDAKKSVTWTLLTHNHTKQHTPTLLQLYQHLRLVRLQLVLDEWAHKMPLSHFPCCQISQQSERNEFSLCRDWEEDDGGGGGGGRWGGGRRGANINHSTSRHWGPEFRYITSNLASPHQPKICLEVANCSL